ncbi:hypothetical protein CTAYLR_009153 [Chrysophaeum taylorii]|uniref:Uncharacterized protein n=1 Tax=Chrysophaeum taylorii TaxID=2483200 RepID=A0AAD7UHS2_9STRA|nr:hypothetical protein CTAYLR_009153 [Chrysophaeum taylorii]
MEEEEMVLLSEQIGRLGALSTPFGARPLVYCDWTASGRGLRSVEAVVASVLPTYGNTHTSNSACGVQSSSFVAEARKAVGEFVGARTTGKAAVDVVLFAANATAACCQLVSTLGIGEGWLVVSSPYEHHSNLLPWREAGADVVVIDEAPGGGVDLSHLERVLSRRSSGRSTVGAFCAASNCTGRRVDVEAVTRVLRSFGALSCWDFATLAPHHPPVMNGVEPLDAVFFSCHKFLGGPGAAGVLVVKKALLDPARPPARPGGGTVFFATKTTHRFLSNRVEREQGGTPDVLGIARAGVVARLALTKRFESRRLAFDMMMPATVLLGTGDLPIYPLMVRCGPRFLHFNFACQLLNDLFGIQARGGCQCAGPYAHRLLGIDDDASSLIEHALLEHKGSEVLRPGFVRISMASVAHNSSAEARYVERAWALVSAFGWRLLPSYRLDARSGEWRHSSRVSKPLGDDRRWLAEPRGLADRAAPSFDALLAEAERLLTSDDAPTVNDLVASPLDDALEPLRWFVTPAEASRRMKTTRTKEWPAEEPLEGPIRLSDPRPWTISDEARSRLRSGSSPEEEARRAKKPLRGRRGVATTTTTATTKKIAGDEEEPLVVVEKKDPATRPPKRLLKAVGEAIRDWDLIADGDRVLLGLSGGKDSLSLLHVLLHLQRVAPVRFELACATVDPLTSSFDPSPLIPYVEGLGVRYFYLRDPIVDAAADVEPASLCAYCARMKRGALYSCANRESFNKLALAHHLDDLAESFVMTALHNGGLRAMRAKYEADRGVTVIRPLVYAREHMTAAFAKAARLPVVNENCPACFEEPKERARVKKLLAKEEALFPNIYSSLRACLEPLMDDGVAAAIKRFSDAKKRTPRAREVHTDLLSSFSDDQLRAELAERRRASSKDPSSSSSSFVRCSSNT